jgi:hydroxyacylglutathione hydrolase
MEIGQLVTGPLAVNTWIVPLGEKCAAVVDPGGNPREIIAYLGERGFSSARIVLTHGHFDHLIALDEVREAFPGSEIAIHEADAWGLGEGAEARHLSFFQAIGGGALVKRYLRPLPSPTRFFVDGEELSPFGMPGWKVMWTPGHSPGSICLHNAAEGVLLSGDTLFNAGYGRTDAPGGCVDDLMKSLRRLAELPGDTVVFPGHGDRTTIGAEFGYG